MSIQFKAAVTTKTSLLICLFTICTNAQQPNTQTFDPRIPFSSYIREDLFAGFIWGDKDGNERLLRGERTLEILLAERPQDKPGLLAWKGGIAFIRAIDGLKAGRMDVFEREYPKGLGLYAEAARLAPEDVGVMAITGAGFALFADRFPEPYRTDAWQISYKAYRGVWQVQGSVVEKLPLHFKGELLAGMAQSAQRTGRTEESEEFVEKILRTMPGTPYAATASKWIKSPDQAAKTNLTCQTCHEEGRLKDRRAAVAASNK